MASRELLDRLAILAQDFASGPHRRQTRIENDGGIRILSTNDKSVILAIGMKDGQEVLCARRLAGAEDEELYDPLYFSDASDNDIMIAITDYLGATG